MHAIIIAAALGAASAASASDFAAELQVRSPEDKATGVDVDRENLSARPVLHVKAGQPLNAAWKVTCTANERIADVLVHFYVAGEKTAGQSETPDLSKPNVAVEGAVTMDFDPKDQASATMPFTLDGPGAYRVQIETLDQGPNRKHRTASALDILVEGDMP